MARYYRKLALLAKIETAYGTDAAPTGAANAILATNVNFTPLEADEVSRDLLLPYLGNPGVVLAKIYGKIDFEVEVAGSGTAGTAPAYGPLLRACGFAEVLTATTSAAYNPISGAFEAATIWGNFDGVKHVFLGARGNVSASFEPGKIPRFKFSFVGMLGTVSDAALPATTLTAWKTPLTVSKASTPTLTVHGSAAPAESFSFDMGNQVEPRFLIGAESIELSDRSAKGTLVVQASPLATVDWFARAQARTRGVLQLVHGVTAGNIVQIDAPAVEIGKPSQGQSQGILNYSIPLSFCTSSGNDEITITVK
jgi:hypothetical protein